MPSSYGSVAKVYVNRSYFREAITDTGAMSYPRDDLNSSDCDGNGTVRYGGSFYSASFANIMDAADSRAQLRWHTAQNHRKIKIKYMIGLGDLMGNLGSVYAGFMLSFRNIKCIMFYHMISNKNLVKSTIVIIKD